MIRRWIRGRAGALLSVAAVVVLCASLSYFAHAVPAEAAAAEVLPWQVAAR